MVRSIMPQVSMLVIPGARCNEASSPARRSGPERGSGRVGGLSDALAADRPGELRSGLAVIRAAAEILDDLAARLAIEQVARGGCLGHFLQAIRAVRFHGMSGKRRS